MNTTQSKIRASKHCDNIMDNRRTSPRRGNMNRNTTNEMNRLLSTHDGPTDGINRYDAPKVNNDGMIIIPQDVIRPKPKTWSEDYITTCLPYCPAFDKRCWDNDQKNLLDHRLTQNTTSNQKSWGDFPRNDLFGSAFNAACKDGWNRGVKALMDAPKENEDTRPG